MSDPQGVDIWLSAQDRIRSLDSLHRHRYDEVGDPVTTDTGIYRDINGVRLLNFCSNDYLDLAHHPKVKTAAVKAIERYGAGAMASRLTCGTLPIHRELEAALAKFKGAESALVFSSGYLASIGVIQTLGLRSDNSRVPVLFDRLSHASLVDAATAVRHNWRTFPHNDLDSLELLLQKVPSAVWPSAIVVTEGVFSMDGDLAPLARMSELCLKYKALLVVDDAHGTGTMGERGEGTAAMAGISGQAHVVHVGTLSKALGSQGGFVAGPAILRDLMVNAARTFIYDTALTPAAAGAALAALEVIEQEPKRLVKLRENINLLRKLLNRKDCNSASPSPICPVILKDESNTLEKAAQLRNEGFLVSAIRPPTVPDGTSRLRVTVSSAHKQEDVRQLAQAIALLESA